LLGQLVKRKTLLKQQTPETIQVVME